MAEEIEIYRLLRVGANFPHLLVDLLRIEHRAWQRAERARFRRGCYQLPVYGAGHRRLDDRKLDLEQLDETAIRPHIRTTLVDATLKLTRRQFNSTAFARPAAHDTYGQFAMP
jgi:hypothetical protein